MDELAVRLLPDVLAGALLADPLLFFVANAPDTSIGCRAYLALLAASLTILRLTKRP